MGDAEVPMRTGDEIHGSRLIVCEIDQANRYYVVGRTWTVGPDGERFEVLKLSHISNWQTTRAERPPLRRADRGEPTP